MKKIYFTLCVLLACSFCFFTAFANGEIEVYVNDTLLSTDVNPQVINGRTMVPMRSIFESLGAEVSWHEDTETIIGKRNGKTVVMQVNDNMLVADNTVFTMDVAPMIVNGRTMVPVRAVAESFNVNVEWDGEKNRVIILDKNKDESVKTAGYGRELASNTGWTSEGWTGDFYQGFSHIEGKDSPLIFSMPEKTGTNLYQIEFDVTDCSKSGVPNASTAFSVVLGNSEPFITYNGGGPRHYAFGIRSKEDGDLKIIMTSPADPFKAGTSFDGTIKNISIKRITEPYKADITVSDLSDNVNLEVRTGSGDNVYVGESSGQLNTSGELNVGVGKDALKNNTSGYWNTAIGAESLENNTVGSRNVAIGRLAMNENISGDRNYAIGTFALMRNTTGRFNVAVGADAMWVNTSGSRNIAIGSASMAATKTNDDNIAIGHDAMAGRTSGNGNVAIGTYSQYKDGDGTGNVAIGMHSQYNGGGKGFNISIGNTSGNDMTIIKDGTGKIVDGATSNVGVGHGTLSNTTTGKYNVGIGHMAGYNNETGNNSVYVGMQSGKNATGGQNTFIGALSGSKTTTGSNNIVIGNNADTSSPESSNQLNIGNTIYGDIKNKLIGINKDNNGNFKAHLDIGASDGTYPPLSFSQGKLTATPVDGALEYDGQNLYYTRNGVRERVILESDVKKYIEEILKEKGIN